MKKFIIITLLCLFLVSCTITINEDGSKTLGADPEAIKTAIEVYSAK